MAATLREILYATQKAVAARKAATDRGELEFAAGKRTPRGFQKALEQAAGEGVAVIAELKRASPSRGLLRGSFPVSRLAQELEQAGATALSVLTDEKYFQGSLADLQEAAISVQIPCLRKDFIVDEYQVLEAKAAGADAVLLIVGALAPGQLATLLRYSRELGLDALCEIHDHRELQVALANDCGFLGVNSRDLETFQVDLETALRLGPRIPGKIFRVAESGIRSAEDIRRLRAAGYQAFLIGESLMRADVPGEALKQLLAEANA